MSNRQAGPDWLESDRLAALRGYHVLDTPPEPDFDDLVQVAARVCQAPIAVINLIDERRQWFKAEIGLGIRETPLDVSICAKALLQPGLLVVPDLTRDGRFESNPLVRGEPHLRFYAGALLETPEGLPLGTLCVLDRQPRKGLSDDQAFTLATLARQVMAQLELRRAVAARDEALSASRAAEERQAVLVRELHHRVRNSLALVQGLMGATARSSASVEQFYRSFSARITSLAKTQTMLTEDYWQTAPLRELVLKEQRLLAPDQQRRFAVDGPTVELAADLAVPLGMVLHELTTNAAKHGALSVPHGQVEVTWDLTRTDGVRKVHLEWCERGAPTSTPPQREGFGSTVLRQVFPMQTNADVHVEFGREGVQCRIEVPMIERRFVPEH